MEVRSLLESAITFGLVLIFAQKSINEKFQEVRGEIKDLSRSTDSRSDSLESYTRRVESALEADDKPKEIKIEIVPPDEINLNFNFNFRWRNNEDDPLN